MDELCRGLAQMRIYRQRPRKQVDEASLREAIRRIFWFVWDGKHVALSRKQLEGILNSEWLVSAMEASRKGLGLPRSRAKSVHRRLIYLLQRSGMDLKVSRQRRWGPSKTREWYYTLNLKSAT